MNEYKNYIFDFDGTVAHTAPEVLCCLGKAFEKAGIDIEKSELSDRLIGPTLQQILKMLRPDLSAEKNEEIIRNFRYLYDNGLFKLTVAYTGVKEKLMDLKRNGKKIFIATNKAARALNRLVRDLEINIFDDIYTVDKYSEPSSKTELVAHILSDYGLSKKDTLMIGDNPGDINAGIACGIDTAAALWGYAFEESRTYIQSKATYAINSIEELP